MKGLDYKAPVPTSPEDTTTGREPRLNHTAVALFMREQYERNDEIVRPLARAELGRVGNHFPPPAVPHVRSRVALSVATALLSTLVNELGVDDPSIVAAYHALTRKVA